MMFVVGRTEVEKKARSVSVLQMRGLFVYLLVFRDERQESCLCTPIPKVKTSEGSCGGVVGTELTTGMPGIGDVPVGSVFATTLIRRHTHALLFGFDLPDVDSMASTFSKLEVQKHLGIPILIRHDLTDQDGS